MRNIFEALVMFLQGLVVIVSLIAGAVILVIVMAWEKMVTLFSSTS